MCGTGTGGYLAASMIRLSAHHQIELAPQYQALADNPPDHDVVILTLARKMANDQPLIQGELVVAGIQTRRQYALADAYPVHFRKTYYPTCFHQHPDVEYRNHALASEILASPPPIGSTRTSFRSCFIPGRPMDRLLPLGEPPERGMRPARDADPLALIGFWKILEEVYAQVMRLHARGLAHGDLVLHNVVVCMAPFGVYLVDFEQARLRDDAASAEEWLGIVDADFTHVFRQALHVQCTLGRQAGALADAALEALPRLFPDAASRFLEAIGTGARI